MIISGISSMNISKLHKHPKNSQINEKQKLKIIYWKIGTIKKNIKNY